MRQSEHDATNWASVDELLQIARGTPEDAELQRKAAWELYGTSRFQEAKELLEGAATRFPTDIEVLYGLGMASKKAGDSKSAVQAFQSVVERLEGSEQTTRSRMLRRLAQGHLNMLDHGAWDLQELTWERR